MSTLYIELYSAHKNTSNSIISYRAIHAWKREEGVGLVRVRRGVAPESEVHEFSCVKLPVWAVWKNAGAYFVEVV